MLHAVDDFFAPWSVAVRNCLLLSLYGRALRLATYLYLAWSSRALASAGGFRIKGDTYWRRPRGTLDGLAQASTVVGGTGNERVAEGRGGRDPPPAGKGGEPRR